jgi:hypothetical protein
MKRVLTAMAIFGLLAACSAQGDGSTESTAPAASMAASADASGGAATGASGTASAGCAEAFAPLVEMEISSMSELGDLAAEVRPTVEACESVADWIAGAGEVIGGEVNPGSADFLLRVQCNDLSLANTSICEELG